MSSVQERLQAQMAAQKTTEQPTRGRNVDGEIHMRILAAKKEFREIGIGKEGKNQFQNFNFRGIDQFYNIMSQVLDNNGLYMIPKWMGSQIDRHTNSKGKITKEVNGVMEYEVKCADGSGVKASFPCEAVDTSDKATSKAVQMAFKYFAMQFFCIPLEGSIDGDADSLQFDGTKAGKAPTGGGVANKIPKKVDRTPIPAAPVTQTEDDDDDL